jgi:hypothetical protein
MRNSSQKYRLNIVTGFGVLLGVLMTAPIAHAQPTNDEIASPTEITALNFTDTLDTSEATPDGPEGCWGVPNNVWYTLTLSEDTAVRLTTDGSDYFAAIDVFVRTAQGNYNLIACDNPRFLASAGITYYISVSSPDGPGGNLVFSARNLGPLPANDEITSATKITALKFTNALNTVGAEPDGPGGCYGVPNNVWYTLTLNEDTVVRLSTDSSDYFTATDVFERTAQGNYNHVTCSDSYWGDLVFVARARTTYYISISSPYDPGGNLVFSAVGLGTPLQVTLRRNATGGKAAVGTATVGGMVTCNNAAEIDVSGQLRQKAGRRIIVGGFSTHVSCNGETSWSAIARSDQGAFGGGKAELLVDAGGCDQYTCDGDHVTTTVTLSGKQ